MRTKTKTIKKERNNIFGKSKTLLLKRNISCKKRGQNCRNRTKTARFTRKNRNVKSISGETARFRNNTIPESMARKFQGIPETLSRLTVLRKGLSVPRVFRRWHAILGRYGVHGWCDRKYQKTFGKLSAVAKKVSLLIEGNKNLWPWLLILCFLALFFKTVGKRQLLL